MRVESLWHPRNGFRLLIALGCAIGLPVMLTKAQLGGFFMPVAYTGCVVLASALGRLLAGLVATMVSLMLLDYYVIEPGWSLQPYADFAMFAGVGLLIAIVVSGLDKSRALAHRAKLTADAAQARLALISEASRMLAASFDLRATVSKVCEQVAAAEGWSHVIVLRQQGNKPPVYVAGAHPGRGALSPVLDVEAVSAATSSRQIQTLASKRWRAQRFGPWRYRSGLVVPLISGNEAVGALVLLHSRSRHTYTAADLVIAGELGGRIAVAVDNAAQYQHQVHIAHTLQRGLLPQSLPNIAGARVYARYQAGAGTEVGGDFYDLFSMGDGRWMAVVGDVCGKGPEAATVMSITRATLRALALHESSPERLLGLLNEALIALVPDDRFVTVCCALMDIAPSGGAKVTLARAGHPPPVVTRKGAVAQLAAGSNGTLLGVFPAVSLSDTVIELQAGDVITFYTDGVESRDNSAQDQALALVRAHGNAAPALLADRFAEAVASTRAGKADDLVVLTIEFIAQPSVARKRR